MLITLTTWATRTFERPPALITLRQWAKSGRISGAVKIGRTWMCDEASGKQRWWDTAPHGADEHRRMPA